MKIVTPVIVTRGNVDLSVTLKAFDKVVVWDNSRAPVDLKVFGRYATAAICGDFMYVQDDDVIVEEWESIVNLALNTGKIVCNMAPDFQAAYADKLDKLVGHGAVFETALVKQTFDRYFRHFGTDEVLYREADRIFTGLNFNRTKTIYVGHESSPYASDPDRLWKHPLHAEYGKTARLRVERILALEAGR